MSTYLDESTKERLVNSLERLRTIQESIFHLNQESTKLRQYIRDFEVDIDALTILANIQSKDRPSNGARLLSTIIQYADIAAVSPERASPAAAVAVDTGDSAVEPDDTRLPLAEGREGGIWRTTFQCVAGVAIAICLFVLVH